MWEPSFDGWTAAVDPKDYHKAYTRDHQWRFQGRNLEWNISIPVSIYEYCTNRHRVHDYGVYMADPFQ